MVDINQGHNTSLWEMLRGISSCTWRRIMIYAMVGATPGIAAAFALLVVIGTPHHPTVVYMSLFAVFWMSLSVLILTAVEVRLRLSEMRRWQSHQDDNMM